MRRSAAVSSSVASGGLRPAAVQEGQCLGRGDRGRPAGQQAGSPSRSRPSCASTIGHCGSASRRVRSAHRRHDVRPGSTSGPTQTPSPSERTSRCGWSSRTRWSVITRSTSGPSATTTVRSIGQGLGLSSGSAPDPTGRSRPPPQSGGLVGLRARRSGRGPDRAARRRRRAARRRRRRPGSRASCRADRAGPDQPYPAAVPAGAAGRHGSQQPGRAQPPHRAGHLVGRQPGRLSRDRQSRPESTARPAGRAAPDTRRRRSTPSAGRVPPGPRWRNAGARGRASASSTGSWSTTGSAGERSGIMPPSCGGRPGTRALSTGFLDHEGGHASGTARGGPSLIEGPPPTPTVAPACGSGPVRPCRGCG